MIEDLKLQWIDNHNPKDQGGKHRNVITGIKDQRRSNGGFKCEKRRMETSELKLKKS